MKGEPFGRNELAQDVEIVLPGMDHQPARGAKCKHLDSLNVLLGRGPTGELPRRWFRVSYDGR